MSLTFRTHQDQVGGCSKTTYDFTVDGGGVGETELSMVLPKGAIVKRGYVDVLTAPTSGGAATVAIGLEAANDLLAATAIASLTGQVDLIPDNTAANMVKLTQESVLSITVAVAALTGGKFNIHLEYDEE